MLAQARSAHPDAGWVRADVRALPVAGVVGVAVSFGALGRFLPAGRPPAIRRRAPRAAPWRSVRFPGCGAAAGHLRLVPGTARVRPGHAGSSCPLAAPVRHVLPDLPAARGRQRPDSIRVHRDDRPLDGSWRGQRQHPAVPARPRAQTPHALTAAYAAVREPEAASITEGNFSHSGQVTVSPIICISPRVAVVVALSSTDQPVRGGLSAIRYRRSRAAPPRFLPWRSWDATVPLRDPGAGRVVCHGRAVRMSPGLVMAGTGGNPGSPRCLTYEPGFIPGRD